MPRKYLTPQDAENLEAVATRLEDTAARLRQTAAKMAVREIRDIEVRDHRSLIAGMKQVEKYAFNVDEAMYEAIRLRGDYGDSKQS
jgi:hypothetical protein